ncbi:MAG: HAE1 family hydrophobic/amphiphilic exporter-1 [Pirellulaceae bacterium]|jgi:HAE1 family hydrophobic/amphiphilic exporter-1
MQLVESFVRNPVKIAVGVIIVILFGSVAMLRMPKQLTPEVQIPTITISTVWPGASPGEMEREIIQEQEEQLAGVEGAVKMSSESTDSAGKISLEFSPGSNMQEALVKVAARLQQVPQYPEDADEPTISTSSSSDRAIAWFILSAVMPTTEDVAAWQAAHPQFAQQVQPVADAHSQGLGMLRLRRMIGQQLGEFKKRYPEAPDTLRAVKFLGAGERAVQRYVEQYPELADIATLSTLLPTDIDVPKRRKFAEDFIESELERVKGVSNSNVIGGEEEELQVIVDPYELAHRGLTIDDVRRVLRQENKDTSAGDFSEGKRRWVVRTRGQFHSIEEVKHQVLGVFDGVHIFIKDVADVRIGHKRPDAMVRRFGVNSIAINVQRSTGANVIDVMAGLRTKLTQLNEGILFDNHLQLTQVYDETEYINSAIGLVQTNIVIAAILTVVVLLTFLGSPRSTLVVFLAIPTSIMGTFLMLGVLGRSLNVISLAGLAFAVGMLVDNAVVVLENIYRRHQLGDTPLQSAVRGTEEVWGAVIASSLTTLAVFLPVVFVEQEAGQLFRDIALAISFAVAFSLIVSVTVIPVATSLLFTKRNQLAHGESPRRGVLTQLGGSFVDFVVGLNAWIQRGLIRRLVVTLAIIGMTVLLVLLFWPKVEYLPPGNRNLAIGLIFPPPGYNIEELTDMGEWVEDELQPYWDVDPNSAEAQSLDAPVISDWFYVARGRQVFLGIRAYDKEKAGQLAQMMRSKLSGRLPGAFIVAQQTSLFEQGLAAGRAIDIEITGPDLERLVQIGGSIMSGDVEQQRMPISLVAGLLDAHGKPIETAQARPIPSLDLSSPEVHVTPRRLNASELGIDATNLGYTVNALVDGAYAADYYQGGKKIDITIKGEIEFATQTHDIESLPIATPAGIVVPLGSIADITLGSGPEQVNRRERQRAITIQVTPPLSVPLEDAIERINRQVVQKLRDEGALAGGYTIYLSGTADKLEQAWGALRFNVLLALMITYLLMAALFESWIFPLVVIFSVPLAAVGGIIGLNVLSWYVQLQGYPPQSLDVLTMLGFVILIGTAVNNAILIVHQSLNHIRHEEMLPRDAILESVRTRIRPIFMTTTTTVFGLLPLVLMPGAGSELYRGLGAVVLGGLVVSTMFTLVLVPTMFSLLLDLRDKLAAVLFRPEDDDQ